MSRARIVVAVVTGHLLVLAFVAALWLGGDDATTKALSPAADPTPAEGAHEGGDPQSGRQGQSAVGRDTVARAPADAGAPEDERAPGVEAMTDEMARPPPVARGGVLVDGPSRSAPEGAAGDAPTLDKDAVRRGIAAATPKIKACYESALKVQPELMGRILVEFKIEATPDAGGAVTSGEVVDTDVASPFFEACVLKEVAGVAFDAPSGAGVVTVRYPFQFANDAD